jgi:hypothetical protein
LIRFRRELIKRTSRRIPPAVDDRNYEIPDVPDMGDQAFARRAEVTGF